MNIRQHPVVRFSAGSLVAAFCATAVLGGTPNWLLMLVLIYGLNSLAGLALGWDRGWGKGRC